MFKWIKQKWNRFACYMRGYHNWGSSWRFMDGDTMYRYRKCNDCDKLERRNEGTRRRGHKR